MHQIRAARRGLALAAALAIGAGMLHPSPAAAANSGRALNQYYGFGWGGGPVWLGGPPYVGSPTYPYYRYGPYYGSAFGLPYPVYPPSGAVAGGDAYGPPYPLYESAGGVAFGGDYAAGGWAPVGRCMYSALAGIGGSWYDPPSYGYYAPFC
ncbi:MAG TPA: hypothetical protein VKZ60_09300 [Chloroflexota bacterium]|jgi:hypothetical protein|nr:hypothetical protein [Chloroflexota bacterium]